MQCTQTESEGLSRVFRVVVPSRDLQVKLDAKVEEVRGKATLKGFRPGKAPAAHIRKMYGPGMLQEIVNETIQRTTQEAIQQADVRPATEPHLHLESDLEAVFRGETDLAFHFHVEVLPEIEPTGLDALTLERLVAPVSDAHVEEAMQKLLESNPDWVAKDGPLVKGDAATIDFLGKIDGVPFEGGAAEGARIEIGSGQFIPGFEEGLIGMTAGQEGAIEVRFPVPYAAEALAGKDAVFEVKVTSAEQSQTPEFNDAFAQKFGFDTAEALRERLREQLQAEHDRLSRLRSKRSLFDVLDSTHQFDLPPAMTEAEFSNIWQQVQADRQQGRLDEDDAGKSLEELEADYRKIAERRVRLGLLLAEIGRRENVQVTEQELTQALAAQARQFPGRERQVFEFYQRNAGALAQLRAPIFEEKVVDLLLAWATFTDREVSREELAADVEAA